MDSTYRDINRQAILYADGGELYRAQCLLRQNVKRHRCLTTLNNLAVFYCENNAVDQNERERDGKWLALHYFEQALALEPTDKTFFAAAVVHYNRGAFAAAADCFEKEFKTLENIEKLTPEVFSEVRGVDKVMCANVDLYSGLVYRVLGIPEDLYTPLFATARIAGWCAHRLEELTTSSKIMRPAYKSVAKSRIYTPIEERE